MSSEHTFRVGSLFADDGKFLYSGPREGSGLLPWVGPARFLVEGGREYKATYPGIAWSVRIIDETNVPVDPATQKPVIDPQYQGGFNTLIEARKPLTGDDTGNNANEFQQCNVLLSCGVFPSIEAMADYFRPTWLEHKARNVEFLLPASWIIDACKGRVGYGMIGVGQNNNGNDISTIDNFILPETFAEKIKNPNCRQARPASRPVPQRQQQGTMQPVGAAGVPPMGGPRVGPGVPNPTGLGGPRMVPPAGMAPGGMPPPPAGAGMAPPAPGGLAPPPFAPPAAPGGNGMAPPPPLAPPPRLG